MSESWLTTLEPDAAAIVPTRSLANQLNERVARHNISQGKIVWSAPNILVWSDYLRMMWQQHRGHLSQELGVNTLISSQQAALLWTRVIEASRREESELTLLNVQQTTRAVQRSWKLLCDWGINRDQLKLDHVADTEQFLDWCQSYQNLLRKRGLIDESQFANVMAERHLVPSFGRLVLVSYDLLTQSQQAHFQACVTQGIALEQQQPAVHEVSRELYTYSATSDELRAALQHARDCIERDSQHSVSIVIPDLQHRLSQVQELARDVFYPSASPASLQANHAAYSFSIGEAMSDLAAIDAALGVIALLRNRTTATDFTYLLRNQFLGLSRAHREQGRLFEQWLSRERLHTFSFDKLPVLYQQCIDYFAKREQPIEDTSLLTVFEQLVVTRQAVQTRLSDAKQKHDFAALSFTDWVGVFSDWLAAWQWRTGVAETHTNTVQYQLEMRWKALLEEFAGLATVQSRVGMSRALELLTQMARNTVFLPKGVASPIVISGVLEAIGREVDTCILTGMHQDYPSPASNDAFILNRYLVQAGHPEANADSAFDHSQKVISNLLTCAQHRRISFASQNELNPEISMQASALFRSQDWHKGQSEPNQPLAGCAELEHYQDTKGSAWLEPGRAKGGSKIFENQSNCAFKAFASHQLGFHDDSEAEFGLDGLDRGNVVHHLLDQLWDRIQTQSELKKLDHDARLSLINELIDSSFEQGEFKLNNDKLTLLQHERVRLRKLLLEWLEHEDKRAGEFSVVEREAQYDGEIGGISYRYIIDRLDLTDDGRSVIIDYKTGAVNRNEWTGDRIKSPQMPLYALAINKIKAQPVSGIAFAQLRQGNCAFSELAEEDIFRSDHFAKRYAAQWDEHKQNWPAMFEQLAKDFLAGEASVNPIDKSTCQYCSLQALCRISQLSSAMSSGVDEEAEHGQ